jgi:hypothetical protein
MVARHGRDWTTLYLLEDMLIAIGCASQVIYTARWNLVDSEELSRQYSNPSGD